MPADKQRKKMESRQQSLKPVFSLEYFYYDSDKNNVRCGR